MKSRLYILFRLLVFKKWLRQRKESESPRRLTLLLETTPSTWTNAFMESHSRSVLLERLRRSRSLHRRLWELSMLNYSISYRTAEFDSVLTVFIWIQILNYRDVRIDTALNKHVWSMGIRTVAPRIRVRLERRRNEDDEADAGSKVFDWSNFFYFLFFC